MSPLVSARDLAVAKAIHAAAEIASSVEAGFEVMEVVGVGASPLCGVTSTLDLEGAVAAMAACRRSDLCRALVNERVVDANVVDGEGMFVASLRRHLARRGIDVVSGSTTSSASWRAVTRGSSEPTTGDGSGWRR